VKHVTREDRLDNVKRSKMNSKRDKRQREKLFDHLRQFSPNLYKHKEEFFS
jgi:hypothetical protein